MISTLRETTTHSTLICYGVTLLGNLIVRIPTIINVISQLTQDIFLSGILRANRKSRKMPNTKARSKAEECSFTKTRNHSLIELT